VRFINEVERVRLGRINGHEVEGVVRVRGIDVESGRLHRPTARWVARHRLVSHEPVAVVVRDAAGERTLPFAETHPRDLRLLVGLMPVAAWTVTRLLKKRGA
jgi:hypothetical protein